MPIQRPFTLASGTVCALTSAIHIFMGGHSILNPLLKANKQDKIEDKPTLVLHSCWHLITVSLVANSALLIAHGLGKQSVSILGREIFAVTPEVCSFVNTLNFINGLVFMVIGASKSKKDGLFKRLL